MSYLTQLCETFFFSLIGRARVEPWFLSRFPVRFCPIRLSWGFFARFAQFFSGLRVTAAAVTCSTLRFVTKFHLCYSYFDTSFLLNSVSVV